MAQYSHPQVIAQHENIQRALNVLDAMTARGNTQANFRKLEVVQLMNQLRLRVQPDQSMSETLSSGAQGVWTTTGLAQPQLQFSTPFFEDWTFGSGLTSTQIMELVDALDPGDFSSIDQGT